MQLDKTVVSLGYRLSDDRARAPSKRLSTAEEYEFAMAEIRTKVRRARTKEYKLVLENLVRLSPASCRPSLTLNNCGSSHSAPNNPLLHKRGNLGIRVTHRKPSCHGHISSNSGRSSSAKPTANVVLYAEMRHLSMKNLMTWRSVIGHG